MPMVRTKRASFRFFKSDLLDGINFITLSPHDYYKNNGSNVFLPNEMNYSKLSSRNKIGIRSVTFLRRGTSADARPAKIVPGRNALRTISGRRAGKDHARTQGPLRGDEEPTEIRDSTQGAEDHRRTQGTENHQWTQGWRRPRQVAMPASRGRLSKPVC